MDKDFSQDPVEYDMGCLDVASYRQCYFTESSSDG